MSSSSKVQSVLLDRKYFSHLTAMAWLKRHKYKSYDFVVTKKYIIARQFDQSPYKQYRIVPFSQIVKTVIEY